MTRPLLKLRTAQLEELFRENRSALKVLEQLEYELQFRKTAQAEYLLTKVQAAARVAKSGSLEAQSQPMQPPASTVSGTDSITAPQTKEKTVSTPPEARTPSSKPMVTPAPANVALPPSDTVSMADAYKKLKATPGTSWESIEQTRRQLVQASSPSRTASLSSEKRTELQADAKQINAAYAVLCRVRCT